MTNGTQQALNCMQDKCASAEGGVKHRQLFASSFAGSTAPSNFGSCGVGSKNVRGGGVTSRQSKIATLCIQQTGLHAI